MLPPSSSSPATSPISNPSAVPSSAIRGEPSGQSLFRPILPGNSNAHQKEEFRQKKPTQWLDSTLSSSPHSVSPLIVRTKRHLSSLTRKAENTLSQLVLKTPLKESDPEPAPSHQPANNAEMPMKKVRNEFTRSSTAPLRLQPFQPILGPSKSLDSETAKRLSQDLSTDSSRQPSSTSSPQKKKGRITPPCQQSEATNTLIDASMSAPFQSSSRQTVPNVNENEPTISGERFRLPHHPSTKDAIKRISATTLVDLLDGKFQNVIQEFIIIDCRFQYEFEGGHIKSAININTHDELEKVLYPNGMEQLNTADRAAPVLIFHCEFSSHRGPRMALHIRSQDRVANGANYPNLFFPELYVLDGGYRDFFAKYKEYCDPQQYIEMKNIAYKQDLKHEKLRRGGSYIRQTMATNSSKFELADNHHRLKEFRVAKSFCVSSLLDASPGGAHPHAIRSTSPSSALLEAMMESQGLIKTKEEAQSPRPSMELDNLEMEFQPLEFLAPAPPTRMLLPNQPQQPPQPLPNESQSSSTESFKKPTGLTRAFTEIRSETLAKSRKSGYGSVRSWSRRF